MSNSFDVEQKKTKWLHIHSSLIIEKEQIKSCHITNNVADVYNISCRTKDGNHFYVLPKSVSWNDAADVLSEIHKQLVN